MKKIFFSALAALSLAACVQEAVVDTPQGDAIAFENAFVDNATRATSLTATNLDAFRVYGIVNNTSGVVFDGTLVEKKDGAWKYDGVKYWIPGQNYYFAALAPANGNWTLDKTAATVAGPGVLTFNNNGKEDLIYAEAAQQGEQSGNNAVAFTFKHLLSKVKFSFTTNMNEDFLTAKVTKIKMTAPKTAEINLASEETPVWDNYAEEVVVLEFGDAKAGTELFAIPTTAYDYVITFNVDIYQEGTEEAILSVEKTATVNALALEMGKAYNFAADINPETLAFEDIVFNVSGVEIWADDATTDLEAEVKLAAQLGGTYTLEEDVTLTTPIEVPAGVDFVLDLNGKKITNATQSEVFGEGEAIIAYGDLTINGEGTVEGTTMAVWARGNNGAKVTINGGTYKGCAEGFAKGGRSVIYASSGNTIDIYGGTFQALAADKTSYANKTEGVYAAVNVADNNGNINVYGGTFVGQNPAAPGTEPKAWNNAHPNGFVAEGYAATETETGVWTVAYDAVSTAAQFKAKIEAGATNIALAGGAVINIDDTIVYIKDATSISAPADNKATLKGKFVAESGNITFSNVKFAANTQTLQTLNDVYGTYVNGQYSAIVTVHKTAANFENCEFDGGENYTVSITYFDEVPGYVMNVNNCNFTNTYIYSKVLCNVSNSTFNLGGCPYAMCVWPCKKGTQNCKCYFVNNTVSSNFYAEEGKGHCFVNLLTQSTPYANLEFNIQGNTVGATKFYYGWVNAVTLATDGSVIFAEGSAKFSINPTTGKPE